MFFRCHCTGPGSSWNLALLAHIYVKVAICKSCEGRSRRHSLKRLSPGNPRFDASSSNSRGGGMVTVALVSPAEISMPVGCGQPWTLVPRSPTKYPLKMRPFGNIKQHLFTHLSTNSALYSSPRESATSDCRPH